MRQDIRGIISARMNHNPIAFMKTKNLTRFALLISLAFAPSAFAVDAVIEKTKTVEKSTVDPSVVDPSKPVVAAPGTLTATIGDSVSFSTLEKALAASGLDVTLADKKGVYTIFAPTDEAFDKLAPGTLGKLMLPQNKEKLRSLLLFHVVAGKMLAADLKDGDVTTMNGEKVKIEVDGPKIEIGATKVFSTNVMASNGVCTRSAR